MNEPRSPARSRGLVLDGIPDAVSRCRDFTRRTLTEWGWPAPAGPGDGGFDDGAETEDVLLLVAEVVGNACLHGGGPRSLVLRSTPEVLRIEVTDHSPVAPDFTLRSVPGRPGGHGLVIVRSLAKVWGSEAVAGGKCVWVEFAPVATRRVAP
ncbi:ATP-binding protein [Streptomyces sp. NBC_00249]|uniref:ATP-binding protein n=1 Tax=Streptomyces sp. NBC_00249 TaxID=2975690 RepID=UPI00224DF79C|nr:ATP-binding protein [Streptomyces sp. NBC_00249]MCX5192825.1 ATP-binding protein [Streptomyces sp. NBC_00249]